MSIRRTTSVMTRLAAGLVLTCAALHAMADAREIPTARVIEAQERSKVFADYTVHFSVFNSAFVPAEVASAYKITRATDQALINISVTHTGADATHLGLPAKVTGTAKNLIQQLKTLEFQTIREGDATYFIAPLKHTNEEVFNFDIYVTPEGSDRPLHVEFSRTLYVKDDR